MIKRLMVVICFLFGVLIIINWLLQANKGFAGQYSKKQHYISLLLLVMLWGTPMLLFNRTGNDEDPE